LNIDQLVDTVRKKPSLMKFSGALKRLPVEQITYLIEQSPFILAGEVELIVNLTHDQINSVLRKNPEIFEGLMWQIIAAWTPEHTDYIIKNKPEVFAKQNISSLKTSGKITESQIEWIINDAELLSNAPTNFIVALSKPQLLKILEKTPGLFEEVFNRLKSDELIASKIDSEILFHILTMETVTEIKSAMFQNFFMFPKEWITFEILKYSLENYPALFYRYNVYGVFAWEKFSTRAPELIQYIFDNHFNWIESDSTNIQYQDFSRFTYRRECKGVYRIAKNRYQRYFH
jgi:hypothetical protein